MKTDLCGDEVVVHLTNPQILTESMNLIGGEVAPSADSAGAGVGAGAGAGVAAVATRAPSAVVECGRRLLLAARAGDTDTVRSLMAKGAPFTTDWLGTSPLHLAAANDHSETVGVLLRAGVSRDARTKVERTPLHLAAYNGHVNSVTKLLEGGALVDARDLLRMTPLHWAVERGHGAAARALLRHGADPHAQSKFRKTPLSIAAGQPAMLRLIEDCLKEREAERSVDALVTEQTAKEAAMKAPPETPTVRIQRITETKIASPKITSTPEKKQNKTKPEAAGQGPAPAGAGAGVGAGVVGVAEALLRRHGITLLPADDGSTVLNALQSGRTVVLSDAGKLMLKESVATPGVVGGASAEGVRGAGAAGGGGGGEAGVVLTATPVAAPPPGVKVFTLNSSAKLLPLKEHRQIVTPAPAPAPAPPPPPPPVAQHHTKRAAEKSDVQQVKLVQLGGSAAAAGGAGGGGGAAGGGGRAAVRIIMNKQNFRKLIATATRAAVPEGSSEAQMEDSAESSGSEGGEEGGADGAEGADAAESVVVVPEQFVRSSSPQYLRSQLLCAHAALLHVHARLRTARRRYRRLRALLHRPQ